MAGDAIEEFYETHKALYEFLLAAGQPTFATYANDNFRRSLILAIASSFEHRIAGLIRGIPTVHAADNPIIRGMIEKKYLARQYHTFFDWDGGTANTFFNMFGTQFAEMAKARVREDGNLEKAIRDFLQLGSSRNNLVHRDYVTFDIDKTPDDIIGMYRSAGIFIEFLERELLTAKPPNGEGELSPRSPRFRSLIRRMLRRLRRA